MVQASLTLHDPSKISKSFKAICVKQPIGDIYIASIDARSIQQMTYFDVRRKIGEERDIERYLGIQRPLHDRRVEELKKYVNYRDATFPSTIIVAVESDYASFDPSRSELTFTNYQPDEETPSIEFRRLCRVIDGQHRIAGLSEFNGENFDVIVSVFIGSDISDQAYVFATVNLEQTKVNRSLVMDLFELSKNRSPYKTCHNIAIALDSSEGSPFFKKIKRLGVASADRYNTETITQATFVDGLMPYISRDPKGDRDRLLRGERLEHISGSLLDQMVFRNLFVDDNDVMIGKIYEQYFLAVKERWPEAWSSLGVGNILPRTNGYRALAAVFGKVYRQITAPGQYAPKSAFLRFFEKVRLEWDYFTVENFKPGSSGEAKLKNSLLDHMGLE